MPVTPAPCLITCNVGTISPATSSVAVTLQFYMPPVAVQISGDAILDGRVASIVVPSDSQSAEIGILPGYYVVEGSGKGVQIGPFWIEVKPDTPAALLSELVLNVVPTEHSHSTLIQDIVAMRNAAAASAASAAGSAARIDLGALDAAVGATVADRVQTGLDRTATAADAVATAADRVQTGLDRTATAADAVATAADRVQTGLDRTATAADRVQTGLDRTATAADRVQTGLDRTATAADAVATAADRVQTGLDRTATGLDRTATAADRVQTGLDCTATAADRVQTGLDRTATAADRVQTGLDRVATGEDRVQTGLDAAAAGTARAGAETARDAAFGNANVYADTAAGLAATVVGEQFQVVAAPDIIRYRHDAGPVAVEVARYPTAAEVGAIDQRALVAASDGVEAGRAFAELQPEAGTLQDGLTFLDEGGRVLGRFDFDGGPVFADLRGFYRVGDAPDVGIVPLVDDDGKLIQELRHPPVAEVEGGGRFSRIADPLDLADLLIIDGAGRVLPIAGEAPADAGVDYAAVPDSPPQSPPEGTVLWRDGAMLNLRDPVASLYTLARSSWFSNLATLYSRYDDLVADHPDYVTRSSLGQDGLGNHIYQYVFAPPAYRITAPASGSGLTAAEAALPKVLLSSGLHGSERAAQMGNLIFANQLCNGWRDSAEYHRLRFGARIVIIPAAVPSGVDAGTRPNHAGVDINRNSSFRWGEAGDLAPGGNFWIGPSVASEPETQILSALPVTHPDAIGWADHHNHAEAEIFWIGNDTPALQPGVNRTMGLLREDLVRRGISPALSPATRTGWASKLIPGNVVAATTAAGLPSFFIEEPSSAAHASLGGSNVGLHRLAEACALRAVQLLLDHHYHTGA